MAEAETEEDISVDMASSDKEDETPISDVQPESVSEPRGNVYPGGPLIPSSYLLYARVWPGPQTKTR